MRSEPYYQDDYCTIYHGDCREVLPTLDKVDLVLTDPPYGIDGGNGGTSKKRGKGNYDAPFDDTRDFVRECVVPALFDIAKWTTLVVTPGFTSINLYPKADSFGVFFAPAACGMQRFGYADANPILYYGWHYLQGKKPAACSRKLTEVPEKNGHPCVKPINAWKWLLDKTSQPHYTILDPFMGSGTTLRAAKDLRRKCIGIELEEKYCEIAAKRLQQEVLAL